MMGKTKNAQLKKLKCSGSMLVAMKAALETLSPKAADGMLAPECLSAINSLKTVVAQYAILAILMNPFKAEKGATGENLRTQGPRGVLVEVA